MYASATVTTAAALLAFVAAAPLNAAHAERSISAAPFISSNFADPSYVQMGQDGWYAFSTASAGKNVQIAHSQTFDGSSWSLDSADALPHVGSWSNGKNVWGPSVVQLNSTSFVMYYAAQTTKDNKSQCVGTATASSIKGPYTPQSTAIACPIAQGGAIDPSPFVDYDGSRYVLYKVDGNSIGRGGECKNGESANKKSTPIMLQKVDDSGVNPIGDPTTILTNDGRDEPLVEAPSLSRIQDSSSSGGWLYYLFYSSGCYSYDTSYATSTNGIQNKNNTYTKAARPLIKTGADGSKLYAPGGLYSDVDLGKNQYVVFHADQGKNAGVRQMWGGTLLVEVANRTVELDTPRSGLA